MSITVTWQPTSTEPCQNIVPPALAALACCDLTLALVREARLALGGPATVVLRTGPGPCATLSGPNGAGFFDADDPTLRHRLQVELAEWAPHLLGLRAEPDLSLSESRQLALAVAAEQELLDVLDSLGDDGVHAQTLAGRGRLDLGLEGSIAWVGERAERLITVLTRVIETRRPAPPEAPEDRYVH